MSPEPNDRSAAVRKHREQQGRWREEVLDWPAGPPTDARARTRYETLTSCLAPTKDGQRADYQALNLMSDAAVRYTKDRLKQLSAVGGLAEPDRLWRNMLSSQPLAFSIVGELKAHPQAAFALLSEMSRRDLARLEPLGDGPYRLDGLDAEWAPPRDEHTGDRSAFDMAAHARLSSGASLHISVEVKYVDTFSRTPLVFDRYESHLTALGLDRAATDAIVEQGGSQFLRSVLLTDSVRRRGVHGEGGTDDALAVVLARGDDRSARRAVDALAAHVLPVEVALWTHEDFFAAAARQTALAAWAEAMRRRYTI